MYGYKINTDYSLLIDSVKNADCRRDIFCYRDDRIRQWKHDRCNSLIGTNRYKTIFSYQRGKGKFVSVKDMGEFYIEQNRIQYHISSKNFSEEAICTAISTHIMGNILLRNNYLLHATTLLKNDHTICFLGNSGVGKSTFSLKLILDYGYTLIADDMSAIAHKNQTSYTTLGNAYTKLWADTFMHFCDNDILKNAIVKSVYKNDGKVIFTLPRNLNNEEVFPLNAIVILCRENEAVCNLHKISAMESFVYLYKNNYIRYACSEKENLIQAKLLFDIISRTPVYLLSYKSGYEYLDDAAYCIEALTE